uniref:Uncharacterized protein n=1 Tax=Glossina pallidipes TaxID=7398 RepID=A0A1A9Z225_GLOPL
MLKLIYGLLMAALKSVDLNTKLIALAPGYHWILLAKITFSIRAVLLKGRSGKRLLKLSKDYFMILLEEKKMENISSVEKFSSTKMAGNVGVRHRSVFLATKKRNLKSSNNGSRSRSIGDADVRLMERMSQKKEIKWR